MSQPVSKGTTTKMSSRESPPSSTSFCATVHIVSGASATTVSAVISAAAHSSAFVAETTALVTPDVTVEARIGAIALPVKAETAVTAPVARPVVRPVLIGGVEHAVVRNRHKLSNKILYDTDDHYDDNRTDYDLRLFGFRFIPIHNFLHQLSPLP